MVLFTTSQSHRRETSHRPLVTLRTADTRIQHRQFHILQSRGAREQVESLKYETDFARTNVSALVLGHLRHILSVEDVTTLCRPIETAEDVHRRRFA